MPASLESTAGTAPSVLLIEEYDALAAAITSALKKFAPQHRTDVVESLGEAEEAATQTRPQLFVIDFDPPHPNAVAFLNRMRTANPEARVLVIASGISPEFTSERYGPNAIQFIEKPFELADFGASVQALLGPWTEARSGDSRGTLRDLNLRDLVPLECMGGATAVLKIEGTGRQVGEIHFLDGHICHASAASLSGIDALHEIMRWKGGRGTETERADAAPRTIQGPWLHVFREALRQTRPSSEGLKTSSISVPSRKGPKLAKARATGGKKIVVIDDTEMLLIFVEDSLSIADPSLQIVTASTGREGARQAETIVPDLVLLDYSMRDRRGDQVCEQLLQNAATARVPIVMMSGHVPEMMATAERYPNVVATIAKPFMSGALVDLVKKTLAKGQLPVSPLKAKIPAPPVIRSPAAAPPASKPVRHDNGKKPARQSSSAEGEARELPEEPISPPPAVTQAPPSPPATSSEVTAPLTAATMSADLQGPATRHIRPTEPALLEVPPTPRPARAVKLAGSDGGAVVLGLGIELLSVQFTPRLQIGAIRAKPSPTTVTLTQPLMPSTAGARWGTGFNLGTVELDADGQIRTLRLLPARRPAVSVRAQNEFQINDLKLVSETACIQLTAGISAPMMMQLVAVFNVAGVELSDRFEVAQLVLQPEGSRVRITLGPQSPDSNGSEFNIVKVRLDSSARIAEFVLLQPRPDRGD